MSLLSFAAPNRKREMTAIENNVSITTVVISPRLRKPDTPLKRKNGGNTKNSEVASKLNAKMEKTTATTRYIKLILIIFLIIVSNVSRKNAK